MALLAATAGCSSTKQANPPAAQASTTTATTDGAHPSSTDTTTPASAPVTEFGATDQVWDSRHKPAPGLKAGTAYDPDPSLPPLNGQVAPRYTFVVHDKGRVVQLVEELPAGTAIDQARGFAMQELPSDATVLWFAVKDTCAQLEAQSTALAQALPANGDGAGFALVEFTTVEPNGVQDYKPNNIGGIRITATAALTPSDAPAC
ncbi:MAG: hypothetical protein JO265_16380 [Acidimicrobiia bacterium]|nr:hypothetical protein [Acidimicrobiia bacterium]